MATRSDKLKRDFLAQYEPAFHRIQDFYRTLRMSGRAVRTGYPGLNGGDIRQLEFRSNGALMRLDVTMIESRVNYPPTGLVHVRVANPEGAFWAFRQPDRQDFTFGEYGGDPARVDQAIRWDGEFCAAPYQYLDLTILEFVKQPELEITKLEIVTRDGEELVKLGYHYPEAAPGWFLFWREKSWALLERTDGELNIRNRQLVEYGEILAGIPLVKRTTSWREEDAAEDCLRTVIEITTIVPGPAASEEFLPAAIGIDFIPPPVAAL